MRCARDALARLGAKLWEIACTVLLLVVSVGVIALIFYAALAIGWRLAQTPPGVGLGLCDHP